MLSLIFLITTLSSDYGIYDHFLFLSQAQKSDVFITVQTLKPGAHFVSGDNYNDLMLLISLF